MLDYTTEEPKAAIQLNLSEWLGGYFDGAPHTLAPSFTDLDFPLIDSSDSDANGFYFGRAAISHPDSDAPRNIIHTTLDKTGSTQKNAAGGQQTFEDTWAVTHYASASGYNSEDANAAIASRIADRLALLYRTPLATSDLHARGMFDPRVLRGPSEISAPGRTVFQILTRWRCSAKIQTIQNA